MKTMQQLAAEALQIQNACNMLGLSKRFADVVQEVSDITNADGTNTGTDFVNNHPVVKLWLSKMHDLAKMGLSEYESFAKAFDWCEEKENETPATPIFDTQA